MFISALALLLVTAAPTAEEVRATTRSLLQSICGAQCDVIEVKIKSKASNVRGRVSPGFDDAPAARTEPASISLKLLIDKKLPANFRTFIQNRVRHRIGEFGLPVTVAADIVPFPDRPEPPSEPQAPLQPPPNQQPAQPIIVQPPAQPAAAPPPAIDPAAALTMRMIEAVPLLLLALLLALMIVYALRRMEQIASYAYAPEDDAAKAVAAEEPVATSVPVPTLVVPTGPPPSADVVKASYEAHRAGAR